MHFWFADMVNVPNHDSIADFSGAGNDSKCPRLKIVRSSSQCQYRNCMYSSSYWQRPHCSCKLSSNLINKICYKFSGFERLNITLKKLDDRSFSRKDFRERNKNAFYSILASWRSLCRCRQFFARSSTDFGSALFGFFFTLTRVAKHSF